MQALAVLGIQAEPVGTDRDRKPLLRQEEPVLVGILTDVGPRPDEYVKDHFCFQHLMARQCCLAG